MELSKTRIESKNQSIIEEVTVVSMGEKINKKKHTLC